LRTRSSKFLDAPSDNAIFKLYLLPQGVHCKSLSRTVSDQLLGLSAPDDTEGSPLPDSQAPQSSDYTPKSETESICMFCFLTVRADVPHTLQMVEELHRLICYAVPKAR
jgi:hypothetical protein